ncbi:MAG: hypothetical protein MRZ79_08165 [Bacteroidia bacterium]|nr:hypothetical protein [Bacteroidia bacterium]
MTYWRYIILVALVFAVSACCNNEDPILDDLRAVFVPQLPAHVEPMTIPDYNPMTKAKVQLGKMLFYDPILSLDSTISCSSCHDPNLAFSDPRPFSLGVGGATGLFPEQRRNAMALFNIQNDRFLFWDGAIFAEDGAFDELEIQSLKPILNEVEMINTLEEVNRRLKQDPVYVEQFEIAFQDTVKDIYIAMALASFERMLVSYETKYDLYFERGLDSTVFTEQEWRGFKVFFDEREGKLHAECFHCHGGPNLDDPGLTFRNNGLFPSNDPFGEDLGSFRIFGDEVGFKVPSLRNLSFTAPYMHDGRFQTLDEVLDFYQQGGDPNNINRDNLMRTMGFTDEEKADLKAFLLSLNDTAFVTNPELRP